MSLTDQSSNRDPTLIHLLGVLGIDMSLLRSVALQVLAQAAPDDQQMSSVYGLLNRDLLREVRQSPMTITHITGEARVLVDPDHRNVLSANFDSGTSATIACRDRSEPIIDAISFFEAQAEHWTLLTRVDLIDIINLFASGAAVLRVLQHEAPVHYSIFGRERILIQEPQRDATERKRVWYVRSPDLVRLLTLTTNDLLAQSRQLLTTGFASLLQWIYSKPIFSVLSASDSHQLDLSHLSASDVDQLVRIGAITPLGELNGPSLRLLPDLQALPSNRVELPPSLQAFESRPARRSLLNSDGASEYVQHFRTLLGAADNRVLVFGPSQKSGLQHVTQFVCDALSDYGLHPTVPTSIGTVDFEMDKALQFPYIVAIVRTVGTASETLALLNRIGRPSVEARTTQIPSVLIVVPHEHRNAYFSRTVTEEFRLRIAECSSLECADDELALLVLRELHALVSARMDAGIQRRLSVSNIPADDQARRAIATVDEQRRSHPQTWQDRDRA